MTELSDAKAHLRTAVGASDSTEVLALADDVELVLAALDELENSYVPHLPAETDTWLRDSQDITLDHPLPPESEVKFHYGPGRAQFLTARATDYGLLVQADRGFVAIHPSSTNAVTILGSVK